MGKSFLERLEEDEVLICDGAMGTMLYSKGIYINRCFDELNLTDANMVGEVHKSYVHSGTDILETNTFGANRYKLQPHGLEEKLYDINFHGVKIARQAAEGKAFVAGSIGPLGRPIAPIGHISAKEARKAFFDQAKAQYEAGVDLFILETFNDLNQIHQAILAVKEICEKPVMAQMAFTDEGQTAYGVSPVQVVKKLEEWGSHVAGINCSTGPEAVWEAIQKMARVSQIPLSAQPNAGFPQLVHGRLIYLASPEYFAEYAKRFIQSGVRVVGGCCGTTPVHIEAIKDAVKALKPQRRFLEVKASQVKKKALRLQKTEEKSELARKLCQKFVTSIELSPPRGPDFSKVIQAAKRIKAAGVDAVNIPDGPRASARMSPSALASILESKVWIETILHYTCRDRNILGMQSDLLGIHALGLRNLLIITGDPPKLGDYPTATAVFDVDSIGLVHMVNNLNTGHDLAGNPIGAATSFHIGVGANPGAISSQEEISRLKQKIEGGAEYILTQPVFEISLLERFLDKIKGYKIPVLAGILPLASYGNAEFLNNEVPGMSIPKNVLARMHQTCSGEDARKIGIEIAQDVLLNIKNMVQGVYLMPPFGKYQAALAVIQVL
ncbi:MAG: bifunctional homocysteine S-methyltransferase/methylenetetrahydrofolate reductase [Candidatus Aminicenantes bacterium]